jgi:hypothetical protein
VSVPVACTVVTRSHLAQARVLASSFRACHPDIEFVVLLADDDERTVKPDDHFSVLHCEDIGVEQTELRRRGAMFGPLGLAGSLKPVLLRHLVERYGATLLIDADSCVYDDLSPVIALASEHGLVLSPHLLRPMSRAEAGYPLEETFLKYGVFNSGFVAVSSRASAFLDWWSDRTARRCIDATEQGYSYEQRWLTIATSFFGHHVLEDPGVNVMWWSLYDRDVAWNGDVPSISGGPLRHFHFTGLDPMNPAVIGRRNETARANFPGLERRPGMARLCREYAARVVAAGLGDARRHPPPFVTLPDGTPFSEEERTRYREAVEWAELEGVAEPPNPFD